jgi:NTP pyrophosphatase (non-canonical NTP hydrolase)
MYESQIKVGYFVTMQKLEAPVEARLLDLLSELGELSKEVLKGADYGKQPFINTEDWAEELGDVYFSLLCLANQTNVDLEHELENVLMKYNDRLNDKGDVGSGK